VYTKVSRIFVFELMKSSRTDFMVICSADKHPTGLYYIHSREDLLVASEMKAEHPPEQTNWVLHLAKTMPVLALDQTQLSIHEPFYPGGPPTSFPAISSLQASSSPSADNALPTFFVLQPIVFSSTKDPTQSTSSPTISSSESTSFCLSQPMSVRGTLELCVVVAGNACFQEGNCAFLSWR